jgi:hypothetical protein
MKDWHIRHKIFHQVFQGTDMGDDLSKEVIIEEYQKEKIIQRALEYPSIQTKELYYPGKSYAVAIIFAKLLEIHFSENFYTALNDSLLLYGNDPYFKPYSEDKKTYDRIIELFPFNIIIDDSIECSDNFLKTHTYFLKEFLIHDDTKMFLPS